MINDTDLAKEYLLSPTLLLLRITFRFVKCLFMYFAQGGFCLFNSILFLRYVGNVMLQDLQKEQKCHFLCNSWLAIDIGGCSLDQVFPVSTEVDLKRFR